ncbi:MAG: winged helix-turn-helix domain-containing protein [Gammaproteobacteria bacterium]
MPNHGAALRFGPYRVHPVQGLAEGRDEIRITPKALAVLYALAERAGDVVTKAELFDTVWPDCTVSDSALSSCIHELRCALGDDARRPRYIETVHRRGFRFVCDCQCPERDRRASADFGGSGRGRSDHRAGDVPPEVADAVRWLSESGGESRVAWINGPDSVSNNVVTRCLLRRLADEGKGYYCTGRANEHFGPDDPYHPLIEALDELCQQPGGAGIASLLRRHAPSWLAELPSVVGNEEREVLRKVTAGVSRERLWAELDTVLNTIAADRPLVIVLEDLQWCDPLTLQWVATLEQPMAAPIFVVVTWVSGGKSGEDPVSDASERCIAAGCGTKLTASGLPGRAHESQTARRCLDSADANVRRVLEAVDILGEPFTVEALAGATGESESVIRLALDGLEDDGLVRAGLSGAPGRERDSRVRYFLADPALRVQVRRNTPASRRRELHYAYAVFLRGRSDAISGFRVTASAHHFAQAFATERAIHAGQDAATMCHRRAAPSVALRHLRRVLQLLRSLPETEIRSIREADLQARLGSTLAVVEGPGSDSVRLCHERAWNLGAEAEASPRRFSVLWAVWVYYLSVGPLSRAQEMVDELARTAETLQSRELLLDVHHARWTTALMVGDVCAVRLETQAGLSLCSLIGEGPTAMGRGCTLHTVHSSDHDIGVCAGFFAAWACVLAGKSEEAKRLLDTVLAHARAVGHPYTIVATLVMSAAACAAMGDAQSTARLSAEGASMAAKHGLSLWQIWARIYGGWAETILGRSATGLEKLADGLERLNGSPLRLFRAFQLSLAAEAQLAAGRLDEASESIRNAFQTSLRFGDRLAMPELYRLRGEVALAGGRLGRSVQGPEADFRTALAMAREQGAGLYRDRALHSMEHLHSRERSRL